MTLGQPGQDTLDVTGEDILQGLSTIPEDTPGYLGMVQQHLMPQANIPAQPQQDPLNDPIQVARNHTIRPEAKPLVSAIESGYADKKIMKPMESIREGIKSGDHELVKKGHKALSELILGEQTFGQWYQDTFFNRGRDQHKARSMAGDVVMREIARITGEEQPTAEEANIVFPGFPLTQEFYRQIPARTEQLEVQQALIPNTFNIDELQNPNPTGIPVDSPDLRQESPSQGMRTLPIEVPASKELLGQKRLSSGLSALFNKKLAQQPHQVPAEIQGLALEIDANLAAFQEEYGRPPNSREYAAIVSKARGRYTAEPAPDGLQKERLKGQIASEVAQTTLTKEKAITETKTRPFNIHETQAKTARDLAITHEALERAKDYAERGQVLEQRVELEKARGALQEMRSQISTMLGSVASADLTKEDNLKVLNRMNELLNTGMEMSHRAGKLGLDLLDFGKPNVNIDLAPTKDKPKGGQKSKYQPPRVDPYEFAGLKPLESPIEVAPSESTTSYTFQAPASSLSPEQERYNQLRRSGLSKEQAIKELQKSQ